VKLDRFCLSDLSISGSAAAIHMHSAKSPTHICDPDRRLMPMVVQCFNIPTVYTLEMCVN
jgi:hypothetical protein